MFRQFYRPIEKPRKPSSPIMGTGNCVIANSLFDCLERPPINPQRGEKELPDLIQCAVDDDRVRHGKRINTARRVQAIKIRRERSAEHGKEVRFAANRRVLEIDR